MEDNLKYQKWNISATICVILPEFKTRVHIKKTNYKNVSNEDDLEWKTTSNIKSGISQQQLVEMFWNF